MPEEPENNNELIHLLFKKKYKSMAKTQET